MPNFDTGHYFLTTLAPVRSGGFITDTGEDISYTQNIRKKLAVFPTALQSPATEKIGINSPFSRNNRTHLCRYTLLNDVVYNGRISKDAVVATIRSENPVDPQPVDRLESAYLMFVVDFDAVMKDGDPLPNNLSQKEQDAVRDEYCRVLWSTMRAELCEIYENCYGFDNIETGDDFAAYIAKCQVETTMPFNDYWLDAPTLHSLPVKTMAACIIVPLIVALLGLWGLIAGSDSTPILSWFVDLSPIWAFWGGVIVTCLAIYGDYRYILANGQKPMSAGEYGDLPNVLKSLYLQQKFTDLAVGTQVADDDTIYKAFGEFINEHKPLDKMQQTQQPGVISSAKPKNVVNLNREAR